MILCIALPRALSFLPAVYGCGTLLFLWCRTRVRPVLDKSFFLWLLAILGLTALGSLWAINPAFALERTLKTAAIFLSCYGLITMARTTPQDLALKNILAAIIVLLCTFSALVIFSEYKTDFFLTRLVLNSEDGGVSVGIAHGFILNRSLVYLVLLCIPAVLMLYLSTLSTKTKFLLAGLLGIALLLVLSCTRSQTAQIAAITAVLMIFYPAHKKMARSVIFLGLTLLILITPFAIKPVHNYYLQTDLSLAPTKMMQEASIMHRLEVWDFVASKALQKPFFGYGIEATRFLESETVMKNMNTKTVLHPHNIFLQVWIEFGLVGVALAIGLLAFLIGKLDGQPAFAQKYFSTLLVTTLCVTSIGYGMWQGWQIGMIFALVALSIMVIRIYGPREA